MKTKASRLFLGTLRLGVVRVTRGVRNTVSDFEVAMMLTRHSSGDWGIMSKSDQKQNDKWAKAGLGAHSAHKTRSGEKVWVITEPSGKGFVTTVLLPEEY